LEDGNHEIYTQVKKNVELLQSLLVSTKNKHGSLQDIRKQIQTEEARLNALKRSKSTVVNAPVHNVQPIIKPHTTTHIPQMISVQILTSVYFNWESQSLPCIEELYKELHLICPKIQKIDLFSKSIQLENPCILFNFIPINLRINDQSLPDLSLQWLKLAAGNSIIVRVHNQTSLTFTDEIGGIWSMLNNKPIILKTQFATQYDLSGIGEGRRQYLVDKDGIKQDIIRCIMNL